MAYKVIFCGTPLFAVPSLGAVHSNKSFEIHKVFTQPDRPSGRGKKLQPSPVKRAAVDLNLVVETPEKISTAEIVEEIKKQNIDLGIVVAYGQLLSQDFLDAFKYGCVNIHSSLLPRWRGAAPMQRAIMEGDRETGVSLQKIVKKLDAGDVIAERKVDLPPEMGANQLYTTLGNMGSQLLTEELLSFLEGKISPTPQDESLVTYAKKIEKSESKINWSLTSEKVHNKIRGLDMGGPFASTTWNGKTLKLHQSLFHDSDHCAEPGMIVEVKDSSFHVACGQGEVELLWVQPENKAKMKSADFIRGYRIKEGDRFE